MPTRKGLLLVNLGTPRSPRPPDVRSYLRTFLSDPRVLDLPAWRRWLILNLIILPFRPRRSAAAYAKIWTERGSPLLFHSLDLLGRVRRRADADTAVELGMRYGEPSIASALKQLRARGVETLTVFPLYPQYSSASTGSALAEVYTRAAELWNVPYLRVVPPFYDHPAFLHASAEVAGPVLKRVEPERVFFSFHGLPERHVLKGDESNGHCLRSTDCCSDIVEANRHCYRAQCLATARLLAERLGVPAERRIVCFQSRLGREPWIKPYTDEVLAAEARRGCRRAVILSPAFVADCLETVEELGMRGVALWKQNGGNVLEVAPCLNADEGWVEALWQIVSASPSPRQAVQGRSSTHPLP